MLGFGGEREAVSKVGLTAADLVPLREPGQNAYVCGSAGFCNTAGDLLVAIGQPVERIKVERFGPTG